jgi:hypothetical protein
MRDEIFLQEPEEEGRSVMKEICSAGRSTENPCTNVAAVVTDFDAPVCERHAGIVELALMSDGYCFAEELYAEAIEKAAEVGALGEPAARLLGLMREGVKLEGQRIERAMRMLEPERRA